MDIADAAPATLLQRLRLLSHEVGEAGASFPSEPVLAENLGVSRSQLREALARLEFEGVINRRRKRGTQVNTAALGIQTWLGRQEPFISTLHRLGYADVTIETIRMRFRRLDAAESRYFERDEGTGVLEVSKRWRADGTVRMQANYLVPTPGAASLDDIDEPGSPVFDLAERLNGAPPTWEVAHTRAQIATPELAADMEITPGDALLVLDLIGVSADGIRLYRTVEHHVEGTVDLGFVRTFD